MRSQTRLDYNIRLSRVIEQVIRCRLGPLRIANLADSAGFSRFHLARFFLELTGEAPSDFVRRIQLERVAYLLRNTDLPVRHLAIVSGYTSPESLARAFRHAYGVPPSQFRGSEEAEWKLENPSHIHWVPELGLLEPGQDSDRFKVKVVGLPAQHVVIMRYVAAYARLDKGYLQLQELFDGLGIEPPPGPYITIYHDSSWTMPQVDQMRADIGYLVPEGTEPPEGLRIVKIPAGRYVTTKRYVQRNERNDAWQYVNGVWGPLCEPGTKPFAFDMYPQFPVPFDTVETKLFTRIGR